MGDAMIKPPLVLGETRKKRIHHRDTEDTERKQKAEKEN